ncbi:hypothetical protein [Streptomyces sp. NPDC005408]|uniref:hypothetical protein n=1 Tax=Streptomyces sp. NPDC005408 TaxID=3155341 RepID=UPI0033BAEB9A
MNSSNKIGGGSFAHGWKSSSCPDEYVVFDVKPTAQKAVADGWKTMTVGFKASEASRRTAATTRTSISRTTAPRPPPAAWTSTPT